MRLLTSRRSRAAPFASDRGALFGAQTREFAEQSARLLAAPVHFVDRASHSAFGAA
jgi:hypothetical protein